MANFTCQHCYRTERSDNAVEVNGEFYCLDCVDFERDEEGNAIYFVKVS